VCPDHQNPNGSGKPSPLRDRDPWRLVVEHQYDAELNLCQARVASERLRVAFRPSTAHDEVMGHSCERCGRPGNLCSIDDPTAFGMKNLNLCVQCHAAIRQMDLRACKWFRRYCTVFRNPRTPIFTANQIESSSAGTGRP
jgi:hypothetical protein